VRPRSSIGRAGFGTKVPAARWLRALRTRTPTADDGAVLGQFTTCPHCRSQSLEPVSDGFETNFFCTACARCWHVELGYVSRVDPLTCRGCPERQRCTRTWKADHPDAPVAV